MEKLDIARIKQYNAELRKCTEKSANLRAQLAMAQNELNRLCETLTTELNVQVTPENLESIYAQCVEQLENTLTTGEEILARIKAEENEAEQVQSESQAANGATNAETQQAVPNSSQQYSNGYQIPGFSAQQAVFPGGFGQPAQQPAQPIQQPIQQPNQQGIPGFSTLGDQPNIGFPAFGQFSSIPSSEKGE